MILISFGTRPEYIKVKPLIDLFNKNSVDYKVVFTGQHPDLLKNLKEDPIRLNIENSNNRLDSIVKTVLKHSESLFKDIDFVIVQGDTTSSFAIALAAFHRNIEAGLRTYNNEHPYPEEYNRRAISLMADYHFCPTSHSVENLKRDQVNGKIYEVGNTVLDNLSGITTQYKNKIIITMHRRENHSKMEEWFEQFNKLAKLYPNLEFIFPIHPNPNVIKHKKLLQGIKVIDPMQYNDFINLLSECKLIITDSGGIQEEASFLKKKTIVCRKETERREGLVDFSLLCAEPSYLIEIFTKMIYDYKPRGECPYGSGNASNKIYEILLKQKIL